MKKNITFLICSTLLLTPLISLAQYQPLQPLNNQTSVSTTDLTQYLNTLYSLGLGIAVGLAVIMILIGGIQYLSTDAISGKEEGKDRITSALWGLLLALCSWIILNTIDPGLLNTNILVNTVNTQNIANTNIQPVNSGTGQFVGGGGTSAGVGAGGSY